MIVTLNSIFQHVIDEFRERLVSFVVFMSVAALISVHNSKKKKKKRATKIVFL